MSASTLANASDLPAAVRQRIEEYGQGVADHLRDGRFEHAAQFRLDTLMKELAPYLVTCRTPGQTGVSRDADAVFESQAIAAYEAGGGVKPWTYLAPGECDKWRRVVNAVHLVNQDQKGASHAHEGAAQLDALRFRFIVDAMLNPDGPNARALVSGKVPATAAELVAIVDFAIATHQAGVKSVEA